mmetsp:Transcript_5222/g.8923  ORF Transcript_5222/g.8923 Transcript_5222/m.8923 type:complete len:294 (+) Transcript_5222:86-967(+)
MSSATPPQMSSPECQQLKEAFAAMAPLLNCDLPANGDEQISKKHKAKHQLQEDSNKNVTMDQMMKLMATMILRLDRESQLLRRQDSFVFFMQMEEDGVVHALMKQGELWHQQMQNKAPMETSERKPLRTALAQTLSQFLNQRLQKLSTSELQSPLFQTAVTTGIVTAAGEFPYHRWDATKKKLLNTDQKPIPMAKMLKMIQQMESLFADPQTIMKFHALHAPAGATMTPWLMQVSMRCDELQVLLGELCGSKLWNLAGVSLKPHSLQLSPQGQQLSQMMGKGKGKGRGHPKGK